MASSHARVIVAPFGVSGQHPEFANGWQVLADELCHVLLNGYEWLQGFCEPPTGSLEVSRHEVRKPERTF
jgi:hypothetical protein